MVHAITELIAGLEQRGIILSAVDGQIRYRAPKGALTEADRATLATRRAEILAYLAAREAGRALRLVKGTQGPLRASIAQEMWWRFGGGPDEGRPVPLNIIMIGTFRGVEPDALADAIRAVVARHEVLRIHVVVQGEDLVLSLNPAETFLVERDDLSMADAQIAGVEAAQRARQFCAPLNPVEGEWLIRAKVIALPGKEAIAALSASHIVTDAGTRNIVLEEIQDILDQRKGLAVPPRPASMTYSEFSLGERAFLEGPQGEVLIDYWRHWYAAQPVLQAPDGTSLLWGPGLRILYNFTIPKRVLDGVRDVAAGLGATPFFVHLAIFSLALARWSGAQDFPVRILGDKRTSQDLSRTVGLMFCADPVDIHAPPGEALVVFVRRLVRAYDSALAPRVPSLHYYPPQCVRPGIEPLDAPNKIPAVFNYYAGGTARERDEGLAAADTTAALPWPPDMARIEQIWTRPSAPVFLHLSDQGHEMPASLHFRDGVVDAAGQQSFIATWLQVFHDIVPV